MIEVRAFDDREAIERVLNDPWIGPKIGHDGRSPGYIEHPLLSYYGAFRYGDAALSELRGVFTAIRYSDWEIEVHAAILPHGLSYSRLFAAAFIELMFAEPEVLRLTAHVIGSLGSAVNFCRKLGFVLEGARRDACVQNNRVFPIITLGLTRSDWTGRDLEFYRQSDWQRDRWNYRHQCGCQGR